MKKIGILGSRELACDLLNWIVNNNLDVEVIGIVAPPFDGWWDADFKNVAENLQIEVFEQIEELLKRKPEIVFSINYWKKIPKDYIEKVPEGIINIHHSYKLKYRGRYSTSWAIINARKENCWEHGSTLHYIDEELDNGPIIDSWKCEITENDTAETLFKRVETLAKEMFKDNFKKIVNNEVNEYLAPARDYHFYGKDSKKLKIDYGTPLQEIYDIVRAWTFKDRPRPYLEYNKCRIELSIKNDGK